MLSTAKNIVEIGSWNSHNIRLSAIFKNCVKSSSWSKMSFKDNSDNLSWKTINVLKISESIP